MSHVELVALVVRDYDRAIRFFVDVLQFDLLEDTASLTNDGRRKRWVVVRPKGGQTGVLLARADGDRQTGIAGEQFAGRVGMFLRVDDFEAAYQHMVAAGVQFVSPPRDEPYGRVAVFLDLEGNRWDLLGPDPRRDSPRMFTRRAFLATTLAATAAPRPSVGEAQSARTKLVLLGTGGGPRPRVASSGSAQVIVCNNVAYVIDCGDGVARQLVLAGVPLTTLRHVFITHQHSDHNADYGNLIWLSWTAGLATRVDAWGPPPLERMTRLFLEMNAYDIETRIANEGRVPLVPLVHVHDIREAGVVMSDDNVKVTAALVDHPPVVPSFGYRFDTADRSIVISGDTARSENVVKLAHGADVLVHSAMYPPAVDRLVARVPNAAALKASILAHQTSATDAGRVAQAAGVKTLVLSHLVPPDDPEVTDRMWMEAAQSHFRGTVIVGKDLLEI